MAPAPMLGTLYETDNLTFLECPLTRMGFRGSRVELRPLRGLPPLDPLRGSPALRAGRVKFRRLGSNPCNCAPLAFVQTTR